MNQEVLRMMDDIKEMGFVGVTVNENEAAKIIKVSKGTLKNWRVAGVAPAFIKATGGSGRIKYTIKAIAEWLIDMETKQEQNI
jgi:transposase